MIDFWYYNTLDKSPNVKSGSIEFMSNDYCIINGEKIPNTQLFENKQDAVEALCDYIEWEGLGLEK